MTVSDLIDKNAKNKAGYTPCELALTMNHKDVAKIIEDL